MKFDSEKEYLEPDSIFRSLNEILPEEAEIGWARIADYEHLLYKDEIEYIRNAVEKRKLEYSSGRFCARAALAKLCVEPCPVRTGPMREPIWPNGVTGSITHSGSYCIAAVARTENITSIGIDIESSEMLDRDLVHLICTEEEIKNIDLCGVEVYEQDPYKIVFSIKESIFKCLYPLVEAFFDFKDVSIVLDQRSQSATIKLLSKELLSYYGFYLKSRYFVLGNYIFSVVWIDDFSGDSVHV